MEKLAADVRRIGETEKLTINVGVVDLGQIDLLVQEGFYSNRTDLIRTAIRNQLSVHAEEVRRTVARRTLVLGLQRFTRTDLERVKAAGEKLQIQVVGLARIAEDVSPELARAAIESVEVLGAFQASASVRRALADRMRSTTYSHFLKVDLEKFCTQVRSVGTKFDASGLAETIRRALVSVGLNSQSGLMNGITESINRSLVTAG